MERRTSHDPMPFREPFEPTLELEPGPPQRDGPMTVFSLFARNGEATTGGLPPLRLFAEALEAGTLEVTEVGEGTVPWLLVVNRGGKPVLILDGEQILGARQNRVVSRSILLAPETRTRIPVSCMEQGRWGEMREVRTAPQHAPAAVRRKGRAVEAREAERGAPASDALLCGAQHEVWEEISGLSAKLGSSSPTGALDHVFEARRPELDGRVRAFPRLEGQLGLLAFAGGHPIGLDAVGSPALWARVHERFVRGYALDALDRGGGSPRDPAWAAFSGAPETAAAARFLERVRSAPRSDAPTVGMGRYSVLSGGVLGGELTADARLVHLSAFPAGEEQRDHHGPPLGRAYRMYMRDRRGGRADLD